MGVVESICEYGFWSEGYSRVLRDTCLERASVRATRVWGGVVW